jgi:hypothetical protein
MKKQNDVLIVLYDANNSVLGGHYRLRLILDFPSDIFLMPSQILFVLKSYSGGTRAVRDNGRK